MTTYNDYIFLDEYGKLIWEQTLQSGQVEQAAQRQARRNRTRVTVAIVLKEVEPEKCPGCGEMLPESGPCWHNLFEEEEIPFQGEPAADQERTTQEFYGLPPR